MKLKNTCSRNGAYILLDNLIQNGVEHIFGYPGGAILPIYDELYHWEKANLIKQNLEQNQAQLSKSNISVRQPIDSKQIQI